MYKIKPKGWLKHADFIVLDVLSLNIAFIIAYITRFGIGNPYAEQYYRNIILVFTLVDIAILIYNETLKNVLKRGFYKELAITVKHTVFVVLVVVFVLFSMKLSNIYSRIIMYLLTIYYAITSYIIRISWKKNLIRRRHSFDKSSMYIITTNSRVDNVVNNFFTKSFDRYHFSGICIVDKDCKGQKIADIEVNSNIDDVIEYIVREWVDEIYISLPFNNQLSKDLVANFTDMGIVVHQEIIDTDNSDGNIHIVEKIAGNTVLTTGINAATYKQATIKRIIDILSGIAGCFITLILVIVIGPIIYIKSPGPIFFSQTRIGKNGKKFKMYKFRSMYLDAEERKAELMEQNRVKDGMMFKLDFDPRIIGAKKLPDGTVKKGIGNYIRDWSLDEFPQFLNILMGTMSLVGTRPPTEDEWNKYKLHHRARLAFKPGITGMWQVSGRSNITDFEEIVKLDKYYIQNWSMGLDFRIMLQTIKVVLGKEGSM